MITTDRQYRVTLGQLKKLQSSLDAHGFPNRAGVDLRLVASVREGLRSQINKLGEQIAKYERGFSPDLDPL
jgi:hypothetical protein